MRRLVEQYNRSYNRTLKCSPSEMMDDINKEIKFIHRNQKYRHVQRGIRDYTLKQGDFVRYRMNRDPLVKHRYRYSPESYMVVGREHGHYIIQAADGSSLLMPRWKLIKSDANVYPHKTQLDSKIGTIERIVSHDPRTDTYQVIFEGSPDEYTVTASEMRHRTPQVMSKLERDYFASINNSLTRPTPCENSYIFGHIRRFQTNGLGIRRTRIRATGSTSTDIEWHTVFGGRCGVCTVIIIEIVVITEN